MAKIYAKLSADCVNVETNESKHLTIIMRFKNEEECEMVSDELFDTALDCFNTGLPAGWVCDDSPEINKYVSKKEAKKLGYVIYTPD